MAYNYAAVEVSLTMHRYTLCTSIYCIEIIKLKTFLLRGKQGKLKNAGFPVVSTSELGLD